MNRIMILLGALAVAGVLVGCGQESAANGPAPVSTTAAPSTAEHGAGHNSSTPEASPTPAGPTSRTITVIVSGGQITGEAGRVEVALGTPVTVSVTSDVADEIHVHGYDLTADVPAGGTNSVSFTTTIPGVFEVELEGAGLQLFELQVS
ncbi:MAG: hypothetical protein ACRDTG_06060 [Pseudonocardiaceae bacterium]